MEYQIYQFIQWIRILPTNTEQRIQCSHLHPEQSVPFRTEVTRAGLCSAAAALHINTALPREWECLVLTIPLFLNATSPYTSENHQFISLTAFWGQLVWLGVFFPNLRIN